MNHKINRYVNFLIDNEPSPFCEYIIGKELLRSDGQTIRDSYDWAVRFKLYAELANEQYSDGSWGGFWDSVTSLCKGRHFKTTAQAMRRMLDLSLDTDDPMVGRTLDICRKYLSGEAMLPNYLTMGKNNTAKPVIMNRSVAQWLSYFVPDDTSAVQLRNSTAERMKKACIKGYFDTEAWRLSDISPGISDFSYESVYMLYYGDCINENIQRIWLAHEWNNQLWYNGNLPSDVKFPDNPLFAFWLVRLENLMNFSLFGEFMAEEAVPYLLSLCERLSDKDDDVHITTNNYFYHQGQYTDSLRNKQHKKNDLLLRIVRLLNKCG